MKVAILLFGEYREFEYTIPSYQEFNNLNIDYYVSTWNKTSQVVKSLDIDIQHSVDENLIKKHLPNSIISIESPIDTGDVQLHMNFHWKKLGELLLNSNKNYDIVVMKRLDTYLIDFHEHKFYQHNEPNTIYLRTGLQNKEGRNFVDDTTYVGNQTSILKFIEGIPNETFESHYGLSDVILKTGLNIKEITCFDNHILRPNMRSHLSNDHRSNMKFLKYHFESFNGEFTSEFHTK